MKLTIASRMPGYTASSGPTHHGFRCVTLQDWLRERRHGLELSWVLTLPQGLKDVLCSSLQYTYLKLGFSLSVMSMNAVWSRSSCPSCSSNWRSRRLFSRLSNMRNAKTTATAAKWQNIILSIPRGYSGACSVLKKNGPAMLPRNDRPSALDQVEKTSFQARMREATYQYSIPGK